MGKLGNFFFVLFSVFQKKSKIIVSFSRKKETISFSICKQKMIEKRRIVVVFEDSTYDLKVLEARNLKVNPYAIHVPGNKIRSKHVTFF